LHSEAVTVLRPSAAARERVVAPGARQGARFPRVAQPGARARHPAAARAAREGAQVAVLQEQGPALRVQAALQVRAGSAPTLP
jgi:hypothetical protein